MAAIRVLVFVLATFAFASIGAAATPTRSACDPSCAEQCRADYAECRQDVREHYKETVKECVDLNCKTVIAQARRICAAHPESQDCADARAHAESCIERCRNVAQHQADEEIAKCKRAARACADECKNQ